MTADLPSERISALTAHGRLTADFSKRLDRIGHELRLNELPLLVSQEGTPEQSWPPSPALQSLLMEDRAADLRVALLVGMAGTSHWSASVETPAAAPGKIRFDLACRVSDSPTFLGSTYQIAAGWQGEMHGSGVRLSSPGKPTVVFTPLEFALVTLDQEIVRCTCTTPRKPGRQTFRWLYEIAVEG